VAENASQVVSRHTGDRLWPKAHEGARLDLSESRRLIQPGERSGRYRTGGENLVVDARGESHISTEDYAVALLDQLERPTHVGRRYTVAY
jgi:hypothetical protein